MLPLMTTGMPIGSVTAFAGQVVKPPVNPINQSVFTTVAESYGWMLCDGSMLTIAEYGPLYNAIGNQYNTGKEASGQFSIPDYRGYFLRMVDLGAGRDPDAAKRVLPNNDTSSAVGSIQQDALQTHVHSYNNPVIAPFSAGTVTASAVTTTPSDLTGVPATTPVPPPVPPAPPPRPNPVRFTAETRPVNVYVNYLIKFI